jgi:hypothetical protein
VRLHDLQREGGRASRIERIAATLQDAHADRRRDPVGGGHHPKVPSISGRVVNGFGLTKFMSDPGARAAEKRRT